MFKTKMRRSDNVADALFFGFNSPATIAQLSGSTLSAFPDGLDLKVGCRGTIISCPTLWCR